MSLDPNNDLLNYQFETYRVSLKHLENITKEIKCELYDWDSRIATANCSQIKAFATHNYITLDEFYTNNAYIVSKDLVVYRIMTCDNTFAVSDVEIVYESPIIDKCISRQLPPVLFFPSLSISCLYDGLNTLHVLSTSNRGTLNTEDCKESWQLLCSANVDTSSSDLTLLECRLQGISDQATASGVVEPLSGQILHCCFLRILHSSFDKNVELIWTKYKYCHQFGVLSVFENKVWRGATPPEMVTFSKDFNQLDIVGDHSFRYIPSDLTVDTLSNDNIKTLASWWQDSNDFITVQYYLHMDLGAFTVEILYPEDDNAELIILINLPNKEPLELYKQKLSCHIDKTLSKWYVDNNILIIDLKKLDTDELEDVTSTRSEVPFDHYEDVDNCDDVDLALVSFDASSGICTEEIGISKNEWLFKTRLAAAEPLSICIRHNVDGLIWCKGDAGTAWIHRHTLNAFGYVSAAKVDRKFIVCSLPVKQENGVQLVVMSDWKRSICVFMQNKAIDADMAVKNRSTGHMVSNTADEFFVSFEKCQEIMGLVANMSVIFVLYKTTDGLIRVTVVNCA